MAPRKPASSAAPSTPSRTSARRSLGPAAAAAVAKTTKAKRPNGSAIAEDAEMADADGLPSRPAKRARGSMASTAGARVSRARSVFQAVVNQIPAIPEIASPVRQLFVFGTGDMGQFGLGPDETAEISRPRLHAWFAEQIEDGKLARKGADKGGFEKIACGGMHTLAVDEAGKIWSWGINDNAALGRKTVDVPDPANEGAMIPNEDLESWPMVIDSLNDAGFRAVEVAAGDSVSVAISDEGVLKAWGSFRSNDGVLGFDGSPSSSPFQFTPISLPSLETTRFSQVSCGADHVLALTTTGRVYVWGNGQQNQLGRRIIERRKLNGLAPERLGLKNIVHVAAGMYHSFAVDTTGTVWAWGLNSLKQTGIASSRGGDEELVIVPTQVDALYPENHGGSRVIQISGGEHHALFLFDNGQVWGVGRCDGDELGLASDNPAQEGIAERRKQSLEARQAVVAELEAKIAKLPEDVEQEKREVLENELDQAKHSVKQQQSEWVPEPVRIYFPPPPSPGNDVPELPPYDAARENDNPIVSIAAGTKHNLAVSRSGHVYSWGFGNLCQLGLGPDEESASTPSLVRGKTMKPYRAVAASTGGQHCVVLGQLKEQA